MFHFKIPWYFLLHFISDNLEQGSAIYYPETFLGPAFLYMGIIQTGHQEVLQPVTCRMLFKEKIRCFFSHRERAWSVLFTSKSPRTTLVLLPSISCISTDSCIFSWESQDPMLSCWLGSRVPRTLVFHCSHGFPKALVHLQRIYYRYTL